MTPNAKELVARTLRGLPGTRVPTGPLAVHYCAGVAGMSIREYTTRAESLAKAVLCYHERFRPDAVWISADTWVSAEAMGALVGSPGEAQPFAGKGPPLIRTAADIDRIPSPDVGGQGRYPLMLEALSRVVREIGRDTYVVACFDQYPFSLAAALMGINEIMLMVRDDRQFVVALMERCLEYGIAYARALGDAGADLLSGGDSPASLLGPELYASLAQPFERRLVTAVKSHTQKPVSLHICGNATSLLGGMVATGADVLEIDQKTDLATACRAVGPGVALWGSLDPVAVLAQGDPALVRQKAAEAVATAGRCGHVRFILSSGCTLAMETPEANVRALLEPQALKVS